MIRHRNSFILGFIIFVVSAGCVHSQDNNSGLNKKNQPKVDVKVNKEYDDKGNVIRYDSTYSYSFSDSTGAPLNDSLMMQFHNFNFPGGNIQGFLNNPFKADSLFNDPFFGNNSPFNDPFFGQNFNFNADPFAQMKKMRQLMDSLNNSRYKIPSPQIQPKKAEPEIQNDYNNPGTGNPKTRIL